MEKTGGQCRGITAEGLFPLTGESDVRRAGAFGRSATGKKDMIIVSVQRLSERSKSRKTVAADLSGSDGMRVHRRADEKTGRRSRLLVVKGAERRS